jgi:hypothetical protein
MVTPLSVVGISIITQNDISVKKNPAQCRVIVSTT